MPEKREAATEKKFSVPPRLAAKLFEGEITLAQLVGMSPKMQYQVAAMAHELVQTGRLDRALVIYRGLVAVSPFDSVFHARLGTTLAAMNQVEGALESFGKAIEFNLKSVDALTGRAELYLRTNRIAEGIRDLIASVEADPKGKEIASLRARAILMMLKDTADRQRGVARPATAPASSAPAKSKSAPVSTAGASFDSRPAGEKVAARPKASSGSAFDSGDDLRRSPRPAPVSKSDASKPSALKPSPKK